MSWTQSISTNDTISFYIQQTALCNEGTGREPVLRTWIQISVSRILITEDKFIVKFVDSVSGSVIRDVSKDRMRLTLYVPCNMFQCVVKPRRYNTSYEWFLLSID